VMLTVWRFVDLTPWALFVPMAIGSIGNGLSQPPGIAAGLSVYPTVAGAASGLMGFLQMMVAALGTFLIGQLPQSTPLSMVAVVGGCLALALAFGVIVWRMPEEMLRPRSSAWCVRA
jgi:MFS transporter, DHA1 family, multidrug resistance protein